MRNIGELKSKRVTIGLAALIGFAAITGMGCSASSKDNNVNNQNKVVEPTQKEQLNIPNPDLTYGKDKNGKDFMQISLENNLYNGGVVDILSEKDKPLISYPVIQSKRSTTEVFLDIDKLSKKYGNFKVIMTFETKIKQGNFDGKQVGFTITKEKDGIWYQVMPNEEVKRDFEILKASKGVK